MNYKPLPLKKCFADALISVFLRLPIATLIAAYLVVSIREGSLFALRDFAIRLHQAFPTTKEILKLVGIWLVTFLAIFLYPYFRTRNPTYIKKQEAYERWKAEKAAKQASPDSPDKSGDTSSDQVR